VSGARFDCGKEVPHIEINGSPLECHGVGLASAKNYVWTAFVGLADSRFVVIDEVVGVELGFHFFFLDFWKLGPHFSLGGRSKRSEYSPDHRT